MQQLLLLDDNEGALRMLERLLGREWITRTASTASSAIALLSQSNRWAGFLLDVTLGADRFGGLDVLREARRSWPLVPAALVTGTLEREVINEAARLGATVVAKPAGGPELADFLRRATAAAAANERGDSIANAAARRYGLTPAEVALLRWVASGNEARTYALHAHLTADTAAALHAEVLRKTDAPSLTVVTTRLVCERG